MNTAQLDQDLKGKDHLEDALDKKYIFNLIDKEIPVQHREDWLRLINNLKLPKVRKQVIIEIVHSILKENGIDKKTW